MSRKNYLQDMPSCKRTEQKHISSYREYLQAGLAFLRKSKTRFDLRDRSMLVLLLVLVIILLQKVVEYFSN